MVIFNFYINFWFLVREYYIIVRIITKSKYLLFNSGCTMTSKHTIEESFNPPAGVQKAK